MPSLFEAYVTNLGKYNEGELVGETLKFPATTEEVQSLLKRIGVDGVRYQEIFITYFDGDVLGLYDDFTPFRNIMNEFYARDTSRKIRSVFKSKGMSGKHLTGTVIYGYLWDEKREHWLVDEEAAEVVRRIFSLTLEGYGPYQIACKLSTDRIEIPVVHLARFNEGVNRSKPVKDPYGWGSSTIVNILKKREYLGHTIQSKRCIVTCLHLWNCKKSCSHFTFDFQTNLS